MLEFFQTKLGQMLLRDISSIAKSLSTIAKELQVMNKTSKED